VEGFPPGMPLTIQETLVFVAPETAEVKVCEVPKSTDALAGVTLMEEGVGVGGVGITELAMPPPHPAAHAAVARKSRIRIARECCCASALESVKAFSERGRMKWRNAGEVPAKVAIAETEPYLLN
jgi:hypothetical protein